MLSKRIFLASMVGGVLAGCSKEMESSVPSVSVPEKIDAESVTAVNQWVSKASGIQIGPNAATRNIYVFFDPRCPHCSTTWIAGQELLKNSTDFNMTWIPVAILGPQSISQAGAILSAENPAQALTQHEQDFHQSIVEKRPVLGGISASSSISALVKENLKTNQKIWSALGAAGVPFTLVTPKSQVGKVRSHVGGLPYPALVSFLSIS